MICVLRIIGYFVIFVNPVVGVLLSMFLDIIDGLLFGFGGFSLEEYHRFDKPVDYIQYVFMLIPAYFQPIFTIYVALLLFRTVGMLLYRRYHSRWLFVIFPNVAEYYFLLYFLNQAFGWFTYSGNEVTILLMLYLFKLLHEYYLHIMRDNKNIITFKLMYRLRLALGFRPIEGNPYIK